MSGDEDKKTDTRRRQGRSGEGNEEDMRKENAGNEMRKTR